MSQIPLKSVLPRLPRRTPGQPALPVPEIQALPVALMALMLQIPALPVLAHPPVMAPLARQAAGSALLPRLPQWTPGQPALPVPGMALASEMSLALMLQISALPLSQIPMKSVSGMSVSGISALPMSQIPLKSVLPRLPRRASG